MVRIYQRKREKVNPILEYTYGLTYDELPQKLKDAMISKYQNYGDKPDFTHMCATILNNSDIKGLGTFAGKFNGIYDVDKNAGYVGDVYGTAGATPFFGNDDYLKNDNNYMEKRDEAVGRFFRSLLEDSNILLED